MMLKKQKSIIITAVLLILACAFFLISYAFFVYNATIGETVSAGQVIYTLYAYGGFSVICAAALCIAVLTKAKIKAFAVRFIIWGIILLSYHYAAQFFANAFNLVHMSFREGLIYASEYVPSLFMVATLIAVICQWDSENKNKAHVISWLSFLMSIFMSAWFIYFKLTYLPLNNAAIISEAMFGISHAVFVPVINGFLFNATRNKEIFDASLKI